jgi:hypothetical protein
MHRHAPSSAVLRHIARIDVVVGKVVCGNVVWLGIRHRFYPLTPVTTTPWMKMRWAAKNSTSGGISAIVAAAIISA